MLWDVEELRKEAWINAGNCTVCWKKPCVCEKNVNFCEHCGEWKITLAPTCKDEGIESKTCAANTSHNQTRPIPADPNAHEWEYDANAILPTCTTEGSGTRDCNLCHEHEISEHIAALGHEWSEYWTHTTPALCLEDGEDTRICFRDACTEVDKRIAAALGHEWINNWMHTTPATCTAEGEDTRICDRENCGADETRASDKIDHAWIYDEGAVPPTCTTQGRGTRDCESCGLHETVQHIDALGHHYDDWTEPTCTVEGNSSRNCVRFADCGNTETRSTGFAALGHISGNWEQTTLPTCETEGVMTGSCVRPGCHDATYKPTTKGDGALGHVWIENWEVKTAATCTAAGEDERKCDRNICTNTQQRTAAALGHDWGGWVETIASTITDDGEETRICRHSSCTETEKRTAFATGTPGLAFTLINSRTAYSVSQGSMTDTDVVIPSFFNRLPVTAVSSASYNSNTGYYEGGFEYNAMTSIIIPDSVTSIGMSAFQGCRSLTSFIIPGSVTNIGGNAFFSCSSLSTVFYKGSTSAAWDAITIGSANDPILSAARYYYSETQPITANTHWRWVGDKPAIWIVTDTSQTGIETVWIPSGTFTMGSSDNLDYGASPPHQVTISKGFYMGKYEVTQEQYQAVTGVNPSSFTSNPATGEVQARRPVEYVTWYDAVEFCNKLSTMEGLTSVYTITDRTPATGYPITDATVTVNWEANGYRLPTEAEWEYACRAGTTTAYNTGNTISDNTGWYWDNSNERTHEVGKKPPNAWGLYDMHGNVSEWCWDWYGSYTTGAQTDPRGAASGSYRVERGGSWGTDGQNLRSAFRDNYYPDYRSYVFGFRLLRP